MEAQQLATKVAQLESRVATLEDEGKIIRGEVKQVLTEIRTAVLVRDNPFEAGAALAGAPAPHMANTIAGPAIVPPQIVIHTEQAAPPRAPEPAPAPAQTPEPVRAQEPPMNREPVMLRPSSATSIQTTPAQPAWSLLTIAGLSAWAEEAMQRLGSLRLEILLDLCETAGHISPEARTAMARVTELDIPEPTQPPSTNETVAMLRQLDALVNNAGDSRDTLRLHQRAA